MNRGVAIFVVVLAVSSAPALGDVCRPCSDLSDYGCVGSALRELAPCNSRVFGRLPEPYVESLAIFQSPAVNATNVDYNRYVYNLSHCYLSEFYTDTSAQTTLIAIDCPDLSFSANRNTYQHQPRQPDSIYAYNISANFGLVTFTTTLKKEYGYTTCNADVIPYIYDVPSYNVQPEDDASAQFLSAQQASAQFDPSDNARDAFYKAARRFVDLFISYQVCDFCCESKPQPPGRTV